MEAQKVLSEIDREAAEVSTEKIALHERRQLVELRELALNNLECGWSAAMVKCRQSGSRPEANVVCGEAVEKVTLELLRSEPYMRCLKHLVGTVLERNATELADLVERVGLRHHATSSFSELSRTRSNSSWGEGGAEVEHIERVSAASTAADLDGESPQDLDLPGSPQWEASASAESYSALSECERELPAHSTTLIGGTFSPDSHSEMLFTSELAESSTCHEESTSVAASARLVSSDSEVELGDCTDIVIESSLDVLRPSCDASTTALDTLRRQTSTQSNTLRQRKLENDDLRSDGFLSELEGCASSSQTNSPTRFLHASPSLHLGDPVCDCGTESQGAAFSETTGQSPCVGSTDSSDVLCSARYAPHHGSGTPRSMNSLGPGRLFTDSLEACTLRPVERLAPIAGIRQTLPRELSLEVASTSKSSDSSQAPVSPSREAGSDWSAGTPEVSPVATPMPASPRRRPSRGSRYAEPGSVGSIGSSDQRFPEMGPLRYFSQVLGSPLCNPARGCISEAGSYVRGSIRRTSIPSVRNSLPHHLSPRVAARNHCSGSIGASVPTSGVTLVASPPANSIRSTPASRAASQGPRVTLGSGSIGIGSTGSFSDHAERSLELQGPIRCYSQQLLGRPHSMNALGTTRLVGNPGSSGSYVPNVRNSLQRQRSPRAVKRSHSLIGSKVGSCGSSFAAPPESVSTPSSLSTSPNPTLPARALAPAGSAVVPNMVAVPLRVHRSVSLATQSSPWSAIPVSPSRGRNTANSVQSSPRTLQSSLVGHCTSRFTGFL